MISVDRAKTILECYGGHPQTWPRQERHALQQAISESKVLQNLQQDAIALDEFMGFSEHKESYLDHQTLNHCVKRIFINLPEQKRKPVKRPRRLLTDLSNIFLKYSTPAFLLACMMLAVIGLSSSMEYLSLKKAETLSLSDYMAIYVDENDVSDNQLFENSDTFELVAFLDPDIEIPDDDS